MRGLADLDVGGAGCCSELGAHRRRAGARRPGRAPPAPAPLTSCSVDRLRAAPTLPNSPSVVVSVTGVRSAGGWPLSARRTCTVIVLELVAADRELRRAGRHRDGEV